MRYQSGRGTFAIGVGLVALTFTSLAGQQRRPVQPPVRQPTVQQPATSPPAPQPATQQPPASSPAQQPPQTPPPPFRTEANYVRVDVYPTADGKPVQDLRAEEFEVLENGAPQQVRAFEHVVISPAGPQSLRAEANSVRGGEQMAANPRNRVVVIFLDIAHVEAEASHHIKEPLIRLMDRILGPDDLIAVMTAEMSAAQVTFGRKTEVIADMLRDKWNWGMRHSVMPVENREVSTRRASRPQRRLAWSRR